MTNASERLYNLETPPPAGVWDRIAAALDDPGQTAISPETPAVQPFSGATGSDKEDQSISREFRERLRTLEATPPPAVWASVISQLYPEEADRTEAGTNEALVIPLKSRFPVILRYAAAVAVLALIGWLVYPVFRTAGDQTQTAALVDREGNASFPTPAKGAVAAAAAGVANLLNPRGNALPRASQRLGEENSAGNKAVPSGTRNRIRSGSGIYAVARETVNGDDLSNSDNMAPTLAERYVTLLTPDGSFIRMSKKLGSMICCVTGDEQDTGCKDQLRKLQEQIARSDAQGNVLDMLDLVSSLDDGNKL